MAALACYLIRETLPTPEIIQKYDEAPASLRKDYCVIKDYFDIAGPG